MKDKLSNTLTFLLDASEYSLHLVTMAGAVIVLIYCIDQLISGSVQGVILSIVCALILLAINIFMRTGDGKR